MTAEAAPSVTDREALLTKWDDIERPDGWNTGDEHHLATLVIDALRSTPQPVRVEVTDDMVEKAARAIYEAEPRREDTWYAPWAGDEHGTLSNGSKQVRRDAARAALEAAIVMQS